MSDTPALESGPGVAQRIEGLGKRRLPMAGETASELADELRRAVRGEVRFDQGNRALYATDASNYRQMPIGVVVPRDVEDAVAAIAVCHRMGAPIVGRGGGTSLAGQATNVAVVIDFSKYVDRIVALEPDRQVALVEPGVVLDSLRSRAEVFGLTFGPDPSTHNRCTLGGMIGNNSCGVHSMMAGCTAENVEELEVVTYDGCRMTVGPTSEDELARVIARGGRQADIYRRMRALVERHAGAIRRIFPDIPRRVSGYNLPALLPENGFHVARLLVGSEGTLATTLRARVRLVESPPHRVLVVLGYPSVFEAADHLLEVLECGPIGLEGMDDRLVAAMKEKRLHPGGVDLLPDGRGWLLVELGAKEPAEARAKAEALVARLEKLPRGPAARIVDDPRHAALLWKVRESGLGATARLRGEPDSWEGWEDSAVAPERLGHYLRELRALLDRYGYRAALYGHFGQGCVHTRIPFDLRSREGIARFRSFVEEAADLVVRHGGSLSGEHGDGQSRAELLPRMFGAELVGAFEELKAIWDPEGGMNPGKVVRPHRLDEDLRLGAEYRRPAVETHFRFPDDEGSLAYATERCVGVGECRRLDGGTMCPSFMVTGEEAHSTRGRAHLLFEMMRGGVPDGWRSEAVREALELCLSCKGCKSDCPVNVDVATYKAEFLAHYYAGRLRPRSAYAFGLIHWWARIGSLAPRLANWVLSTPPLSRLATFVAGVSPRRDLPRFASATFKEWWRAHSPQNPDGPAVILWVDTFNDHWQPAVPIAAVDVLESAGYQVIVPLGALCCGRPLYDYGMLRLAKRQLRQILAALRPAIREGLPVVGLEPSCVAVLRDELVNLFPDDPDAAALARQTFMLDELLEGDGTLPPVRLERGAIVQGHCHHKAVLRFETHQAVLERVGVRAQVLDSGCCGMAGAFGYERGHEAVSDACGERKLLPAVRAAPAETLVIADGFSCRQQIRQHTHRRALHLAQVLQMAAREGPEGPRGVLPEEGYADVVLAPSRRRRVARALLLVAAGAVAAGLAVRWSPVHRRAAAPPRP